RPRRVGREAAHERSGRGRRPSPLRPPRSRRARPRPRGGGLPRRGVGPLAQAEARDPRRRALPEPRERRSAPLLPARGLREAARRWQDAARGDRRAMTCRITLYGTARSRASRSLIALEELGVQYKHVPLFLGGDTPEVRATLRPLNPNSH